MLSEFEDIEEKYGSEKGDDLRNACRHLLQNQFVFSGDRGSVVPYNTLTNPSFRIAIDGFFDCIGLSVERQAEEQWVGIVPKADEVKSLPRIGISDTVMILTLAAQWQEQVDQGNVEDRAVVATTLNQLHERYLDMVQGVTAPMTISAFEAGLELARERGLVWKGEADPDLEDKEIRIRPMIKLVAGADALKRIEDFVRVKERDIGVARHLAAAAATEPSGQESSGNEEQA